MQTLAYTGAYRQYVTAADQVREQAAHEGRVVVERNTADTVMPARVRLEFPTRGNVLVYGDGVETHLVPGHKRAIISRGGSVGITGAMWYASVLDERYPASARLPWEKLEHVLENATVLRRETPAEVDGILCDVIYYEGPDDWWRLDHQHFGRLYLSAADHFLRKSVSIPARGGKAEPGRAELVFRDLEVGVALPEGAFTAEIPEDFDRREFESAPAPRLAPPALGAPAPSWALKDPSGNTHRLGDYRGRVILLFFWGTWCRPCAKIVPSVRALRERFRERGMVVMGISCQEPPGADPAGVMKEHGFDEGVLLEGDAVANAYGVPDLPAFFLIGPNGEVVHRHAGADPAMEVVVGELIEEFLNKKSEEATPTESGRRGDGGE
ncbi:MAG: peroxiredoxin family protein [Planctomycetota bacterium]